MVLRERDVLLIQEPEHPERHLVVEDIFRVVLDHIAIFHILNLLLPFLTSSHLKGFAFYF